MLHMTKHHFSLLALGDSYTIGEAVPLHQSFPYQAIQLLRQKGLHFYAPEIIAQTGFTTFELAEQILHTKLNDQYDFVTLLIGVNNQYRGLPVKEYKQDVDFLLHKAIHFAAAKTERVLVLSIPDWGVTPFAHQLKKPNISKEIDAFNAHNAAIAKQYGVHYINITPHSRAIEGDSSFLAADGLHYSGKTYAYWAAEVADRIAAIIKQ